MSSKDITFYLVLLPLFTIILNAPCVYQESSNGIELDTNSTTLEGLNENEAKQKCFSYSNSDVFNDICCYDSTNKLCKKKEGNENENDCPKESLIFNNCGMASFYDPITSETCTDISLVKGYCCFANFTNGRNACIRTKELNKNKNEVTGQMRKYLNKVKEYKKEKKEDLPDDLDFDNVICQGNNLKNYLFFMILAVISLF